MKKIFIVFFLLIIVVTIVAAIGTQTGFASSELKPYIDKVAEAKGGMTLWQMIKSGGFIMVVLTFFSIACVTIAVYSFISIDVNKLSPKDFAQDIMRKLEQGKHKAALAACKGEDNIIASIVASGLEKKDKGNAIAREAMENCARKEINSLWQTISYLSDIAATAPLVGLLGTVIGMIQAFNVIAFQTAVVKPILLAGGVSKAMVTTAGGLIVAIPAMILYSYFKAKVQETSNIVENYSSDMIRLIAE